MQLDADEEEHVDEDEGEAEAEPGDCCGAVQETGCDMFCTFMRSSAKLAALMLLRILQAPFPFVIKLFELLLAQLDMQWPGGRPECKSDVLLLFVEASLVSWL